MKRIILTALTLPIICFGCGQKTTYIQTGGTQSIVSVGEVDIQDIQVAARGLLDSMLLNGVLNKAKHQPARIVLQDKNIINDTGSVFNTGELLYRMRAQLVNSGQAEIEMGYGKAESIVAQEQLKKKAFLEGKTASDVFDPDFDLTGRITQMRRSAGNTSQMTYTFRLTLTNLHTGREAWTDYVNMTKQGSHNSIGF